MRGALLLFLVLLHRAASAPYATYENTSLCLGETPSDTLRNSLLMCRELEYDFCVNASLIGTLIHAESKTAKHFADAVQTPTQRNVEKLAWLVDSALVLLYETFTTQRGTHISCAHEWRSWVCSRAFLRAVSDTKLPLPACSNLCEKAEAACSADMHCVPRDDKGKCTDFFNSSGQGCVAVLRQHSKRSALPVFREPAKRHHTTASATRPSSVPLLVIVAISILFQHR